MVDIIDQLSKLAKMHAGGMLTDQDFKALKEKLIKSAALNHNEHDRSHKDHAIPSDNSVLQSGTSAFSRNKMVFGLFIAALVVACIYWIADQSAVVLEAEKGPLCRDSRNPDCALIVVKILNKGRDPLKIGRVTINDKKHCFYDVNQLIGMGNSTTITAFGLLEMQDSIVDTMKAFGPIAGKDMSNLPSSAKCGEIVKMKIETDKGTTELTW